MRSVYRACACERLVTIFECAFELERLDLRQQLTKDRAGFLASFDEISPSHQGWGDKWRIRELFLLLFEEFVVVQTSPASEAIDPV